MNVKDLKEFLASLSRPLSAGGAKKAADDLDRMGAALEPFADLSIAAFVDFLTNAEMYARTGVVPTTGRAKSAGAKAPAKAADPQALAVAVEQIRSLHERVSSPDVTYSDIEAEVKRLAKQFTKDAVLEIAKAVGISSVLKSKKAAIDEIQRRLKERKESFERTRF